MLKTEKKVQSKVVKTPTLKLSVKTVKMKN